MTKAETKQWYSVSITVAPEVSETIEYAFNSLEALGTEIHHFQKKDAETVTVVGYFNAMPDEEHVEDELHYALRAYGLTEDAVLRIERAEIENADWLSEWKKHWKPTEVGSFVIAPPWSDVSENKVVIRIEPNMAFGTGTHETTQLCLQAIDQRYQAGDSFLDVGTGTGILAIAAAKINLKSQISNFKSEISDLESQLPDLKSEPSDFKSQISNFKSEISDLQIVACDTDADAVSIARENAELNGVGGSIEFFIGSISADTRTFDFVCANLTLDVIAPILALLIEKTKGTLVLSGILSEQRNDIVRMLRDLGFPDAEVAEAGEWVGVVVNSE